MIQIKTKETEIDLHSLMRLFQIKQSELAKAAGCSKAQITRVMCGQRNVSSEFKRALSKGLIRLVKDKLEGCLV